MTNSSDLAVFRAPVAGFLAWLVPGLGHFFLGHRGRGLVFLVTITATFWSGVAIGGVRATVDPQDRALWFVAQLCTGANTAVAFAMSRTLTATSQPGPKEPSKYVPPYWVSAEVGVHYTGVAGLLNLLVVLDAIALAELAGASARKQRLRAT